MLERRTLKNEFDTPHRGTIPQKLFKAFDQKEYAEAFIQGLVFFRALTSMRNIESAGADRNEGSPAVDHGPARVTLTNRETGETISDLQATSSRIGWRAEAPEKRFVACFSGFSEPPHSSKFGDFIVEVFDAPGMIMHWQHLIDHLEYAKIEYFDPQNLDAIKMPGVPPWQLKEKIFEDEKEFRISFEAGNLNELTASVDPRKHGASGRVICQVDAINFDFGSNRSWARLLPEG